jgi:hypothetical protein
MNFAGFAGIHPITPCMRARARYTGGLGKKPQTPQTSGLIEDATSGEVGTLGAIRLAVRACVHVRETLEAAGNSLACLRFSREARMSNSLVRLDCPAPTLPGVR